MASSPTGERASILLMEECFAAADAGFLDALRQVGSPRILAAFADRWKTDNRPWARVQLLAYLDHPLDCPGHQPLVKRLFKGAEARKDDELMAAFLVAFDVQIRRDRATRWHWDRASRSSFQTEHLVAPRDVLPRDVANTIIHPKTGERIVISAGGRRVRRGRLFTHRTRHYLRRRVWRYFRHLGYARPADYPTAIAPALRNYRDEHLAKGENILDSWALLHVCFQDSPALEFQPAHVRLKEGHTLASLSAAPRFAAAWETPVGAGLLLDLIASAPAQLVRLWAIELFRRVHPRSGLAIAPANILNLLDHEDPQVQQFGAQLFASLPDLGTLPLDAWLRLLGTRNLTALATLAEAFGRHVAPERLSLAQSIALACAQPTPVARLGWQILSRRAIASADRPALAALADARCPAVAADLTAWALGHFGEPDSYQLATICRFFDSLGAVTRDAAWQWLLSPSGSAGYDDPVLWSRLAETPFDDLRLRLVDHLALRVKTPSLSVDQLAPVWCNVLLGVHRGGRQKLKAVREITAALVADSTATPRLLPVLVVAVRSVRGPEMRAGLAAVMSLVAARPSLASAIREQLPELHFNSGEAAA